VSNVVEKKQTLPILSNVMLATKDRQLLLTGTDLEVEVIGFTPIDALTAEGSVTVSARKFFDICRALPEGTTLRLTTEKNSLIVRAGESCFTLNTLPTEDFPRLEEVDYAAKLTIKQQHLKNLFSKTYFAMGHQDVRHYLNGAFLDIRQNSIKCVAADGHRLALAEYEEDTGDVEASVILPRKSVLELIRLLTGDSDSDVTLQLGDNRVRIVCDEFIFTTKLINAQYPDYKRLVPNGTTVATGNRETIKHALSRASILSNEKFRGIRFQLEPGKLRITANNTDQEQAEDVVSLDYEGDEIEIGFNVAYLLDALSALTDKATQWVFSGPDEGVLIKSADNNKCLYVVMPMRL